MPTNARLLLLLVSSFLVALGCGGATSPAPATAEGAVDPSASAEPPPGPAIAVIWTDATKLSEACNAAIANASHTRTQITKLDRNAVDAKEALALFDAMERSVDEVGGIAGAMANLHPDAAVRDAADRCEQAISKFDTDASLDRDLYAVASAISGDLGSEDARYLKRILRAFLRAGVDKDEATRKRLAALDERMVKISQDYERNVREDVRHIEVTKGDLAGLPDDYVAGHAPGENGKIRITTDYPDFFPFETYAKDANLRKELYLAFLNRGYPKNEALLLEMLQVRKEYAGLLGYDSWPAYATADMMAGSADSVRAFVGELREAIRPPMEKDIAAFLARKRKDQKGAKRFEVWDRFYYRDKIQSERHNIDTQAIRAYFSYPKVRDGILALYGDLFGVEFRRLEDAPTWHESVEAYALYRDGKEEGRFFFDNHPREGKFKHAAAQPIRSGDRLGRIPVATLMQNFANPAEGPALMEHSDVVTFFHEFGHLMHHLLGTGSRYIADNGFATEWDFVEAPSQLLEEWAWSPEVLATFATHQETGEPIPADLVTRMRAAEEFGKAASLGRQLFYTAVSFELHAADPAKLDLEATMDK
ncbi:MAG: Zn-dependent oligopeptidase, partial [Myxococcales bacterium]|nr:Zn-dependent oligopeptidase [Myxococcales bacterium]